MSIVERAKATDADSTEDTITDYLQAHPDFFERHTALLTTLQLPHSTGGAAISLVERQVAALRQQHQALEQKLRELVEVAHGNDDLAGKIHALSMLLLATTNRDEVVAVLERQLLTAFSADQAKLVLFDDTTGTVVSEGQFLVVIKRDDSAIASFKTFLKSSTARCGTVRDAQRDFLFGPDNIEIGSVALVPLGLESELGFLAIGSHSADHFNPGKSIDFLARLAELLTCALKNRP
jgi:uncharacterized protein YigA (DUF484 family)